MLRRPPTPPLFPYTTLFRSRRDCVKPCARLARVSTMQRPPAWPPRCRSAGKRWIRAAWTSRCRSEEHTSELQSRGHLVCRLLLEKKKKQHTQPRYHLTDGHH